MSEILVHVTRGGMVESVHRGDLVVVDTAGTIICQIGDPHKKTFWRSAAKPFQVLPLVESGGLERFHLSGEELALMCSSHGGEELHVATALGILKKLNRSPQDLECGIAAPMYPRAAQNIQKSGGSYSTLTNPCSGKHANMIALAILRGHVVSGYSQVSHPVQHELLRTISDMTGLFPKDITIGIDGCGVPVFGLPLFNMAVAYAHLAKPGAFPEPRASALGTIASAMMSNPFFVAGSNRLDTVLMEAAGGKIVAKLGAEGVYCLGLTDKGIGLALKVEDGNYRAIDPIIMEILNRLGYLAPAEFEKLRDRWDVSVRNHRKEIIGSIRAVF